MAKGQPILPLTVNTDISSELLPENVCRFIKNMTIKKGSNGTVFIGHNEEKQKPLQSNQQYAPLTVPEGTSYCFSAKWFDVVNEIYCWCWNSENNHFIYRIRCYDGVAEMIKIDSNFNFKLKPEYFVHESASWVEVVRLIDPITGNETIKRDLYWTDGLNFQRYLRIDDCIATNGFDASTLPYFLGTYDVNIPISMGVPTLDYCIGVTEIPIEATDNTLNNDLLYQTWKFRVRGTDVFGRPNEHGIIAYYKPGINDCLAGSDNVPRCLSLVIKVDNPFIDSIDIEYTNDNATPQENIPIQWYKTETVFLYTGDKINNWWLRQRNPNTIFNSSTKELTVLFCADGEHEAVPLQETTRLFNPLPNSSQGLIKLTKRLALFNNRSGFNPLSQDLLSKIKTTIEYPTATTNTDLATITIDIPIYNIHYNNFQQVHKDGTNGYIFGDTNHDPRKYSQYFANIAQSSWIGYLNDGDSTVGQQVYVDASGNLIPDPDFNGMSLSPVHLVFQRFVFNNKKKGNYIFRLSSHLTDPTVTSNFKITSTTIWGLCPYTHNGDNFNINVSARQPRQELFINCCNGNYDTLKDNLILIIADLAYFDSRCQCGYIYETNANGFNQYPMELISVTNPAAPTSLITDHNGFYWFSSEQRDRTFQFSFLYKCVVDGFTQGTPSPGIQFVNEILSNGVDGNNKWSDFFTAPCDRILIKGRAVIQGTNIGVSNAAVTLARGGSAVTDNNGNFTIVAHDDCSTSQHGRNDKLLFSSTCIYHENGGCISVIDIHAAPCSLCALREVFVRDWILSFDNFRGLLSGGGYRKALCGADWLGRRQFIQDLGALNIPTVAQTGVVAPCKVRVDIDTTAIFPAKFKWISFFITAELNYADFIEWIVDKAELIDNTGGINTANPTQIRIWYSSLNEFNKQNNFSTTAMWQFLVQSTSNPVTGDKVQFIINGDNTIYADSITALVKYDKEGQFFLIDYKPSLATLTSGGKIRLVRPKASYSEEEPFYEICDSRVNLNNGIPDRHSLYLNAFDTYYLSNQIPVPTSLNNLTAQVTTGTIVTSGNTQTSTSTTTTQNVAYANELKSFGFYFEHHSPSYLWGLKCWNYGRVNVRNIDEAEQINFNQVALSGELLPTGILSYLQYFDTALMTSFDVLNTGGLFAALVMPGRVLWLTQHANFITPYNDNLLRQNSGGTISASAANGFGQPDTIEDYKYGVLAIDKNTVGIRNDTIIFLDRTLCELVGLRPTNTGGTIHYTKNSHDMIFIEKIKSMIGSNRYFHKGINPLTDEYLLTDFNLDDGSTNTDSDGDGEDNGGGNIISNGVLVGVNGVMANSPRSFSDLDVQNAVKSLGGINIMRYPGGNIANSFNWRTGKDDDGSGYANTIEDITALYNSVGCDILFVLNMLTKTLADQLEMLAAAFVAGIPIKYVELGNEFNNINNPGHITFPLPQNYADEAEIWRDAIKAVYPQCLVFMIGGNRNWSGGENWNDPVVAKNPDGLTWHVSPNIDTFWNGSIIDFAAIDADINTDWTDEGFDLVTTVPICATETNYTYDAGNILPPDIAQAVTFYIMQKLPLFIGLNDGLKMMCVRGIEGNKQGALLITNNSITVQATGYAIRQYLALPQVVTNTQVVTNIVSNKDAVSKISYINQERWYNAEKNETLSFDIAMGAFLGTFSFTPESYAYADGDIKQKNLFAFKNAIPYNHYSFVPTTFNTFFGVVCERVFVLVHNGQLLKEKYFQWIEFYSKYCFYSPLITTDSGQISRLAKSQWKRTNKFYKTSFLRDILTPDVNNRISDKLFEGNPLYGRYVVVTLVGDAKDNQLYTDVSGIIMFSSPLEKSGA